MGTTTGTGQALLAVRELSIALRTASGEVQAVQDVSFTIGRGEVVGMAGESGSGKSLTGLAILGLLPRSTSRVGGQILFQGRDLLRVPEVERRRLRGRDISMVFQEPMTALDPLFTVGYQISETLRAHQRVSREGARRAALEMLEAVGVADPRRRYDAYPHQLSGGMCQRVMIAMALICKPALLIADEPTTAVDVTIQAQILDLIRDLTARQGTAVLFISHDVGVLADLCSRIIIVYAGEVVESGPTDDVLEQPLHPYTAGLLASIPTVHRLGTALSSIPGRVPPLTEMPTGCRFHPRCAFALPACTANPQVLDERPGGRSVRCWRHRDITIEGAAHHARA